MDNLDYSRIFTFEQFPELTKFLQKKFKTKKELPFVNKSTDILDLKDLSPRNLEFIFDFYDEDYRFLKDFYTKDKLYKEWKRLN